MKIRHASVELGLQFTQKVWDKRKKSQRHKLQREANRQATAEGAAFNT